jgi:hypothetical protein
MFNFIIGLLIGAVIMDFAWGWKMGIPQLFCSKLRYLYRRVTAWTERTFH